MRHEFFLQTVTIAFTCILVSACKVQENGSRLESLQEFVGENLGAAKQCSGVHGVNIAKDSISSSQELGDQVLEVLTAIPHGLQEEFFIHHSGRVVISPSAAQTCLSGYTNNEEFLAHADNTGIEGCWREDALKRPTIYLMDNPQSVRGGLVRVFSFYISEVMLASNEAFQTQKKYIALQFLQDVLKSAKYDLSAFRGLIDDAVVQAKTTEELVKAWEKVSPEAKNAFANTTIAEAVDQWFCSEKTKAELDTEKNKHAAFPLTGKAFRDLAMTLETYSPKVEGNNEGFSLMTDTKRNEGWTAEVDKNGIAVAKYTGNSKQTLSEALDSARGKTQSAQKAEDNDYNVSLITVPKNGVTSSTSLNQSKTEPKANVNLIDMRNLPDDQPSSSSTAPIAKKPEPTVYRPSQQTVNSLTTKQVNAMPTTSFQAGEVAGRKFVSTVKTSGTAAIENIKKVPETAQKAFNNYVVGPASTATKVVYNQATKMWVRADNAIEGGIQGAGAAAKIGIDGVTSSVQSGYQNTKNVVSGVANTAKQGAVYMGYQAQKRYLQARENASFATGAASGAMRSGWDMFWSNFR